MIETYLFIAYVTEAEGCTIDSGVELDSSAVVSTDCTTWIINEPTKSRNKPNFATILPPSNLDKY